MIALFLLTIACLNPPPHAAAQESGWGHLTGQIVVSGQIPAAEDLTLSTDDKQYCLATGESFTSRKLLVGSEGQLQDAYVMMYFGRRDRERPEVHPSYNTDQPVLLDNVNCRFEPRAIFVRAGQSVQFRNSDRIGHNCHVVTMNFEENCSLGAGQSLEVAMEESSRVPGIVKCDAHPWMEALLLIRDEPYAAITDKEGRFRIENIPAGKWTFQFWHAQRGFLRGLQKDGADFVGRRGEVEVEIPDGGTLDLGTLKISAEALLED
jgi:plastocyanin